MKLTEANIKKNLVALLKEYNASDVKKGFRLYKEEDVDIIDFNEKLNSYQVEVQSESEDDTFWAVTVAILEDAIETECECPAFEDRENCKHVVAAAIEILYMEADTELDEVERIVAPKNPGVSSSNSQTSLATARTIPLFTDGMPQAKWHSFKTNPQRAFSEVYSLSAYSNSSKNALSKVKLVKENKETPSWQFEFKSDAQTVLFPEIRYDRDSTFEYFCNCNYSSHMCQHSKASFDVLESKYGRDFFMQFKDWTKEKAKLLEEYGLKPDDKEVEKIKFTSEEVRSKLNLPHLLWKREGV